MLVPLHQIVSDSVSKSTTLVVLLQPPSHATNAQLMLLMVLLELSLLHALVNMKKVLQSLQALLYQAQILLLSQQELCQVSTLNTTVPLLLDKTLVQQQIGDKLTAESSKLRQPLQVIDSQAQMLLLPPRLSEIFMSITPTMVFK